MAKTNIRLVDDQYRRSYEPKSVSLYAGCPSYIPPLPYQARERLIMMIRDEHNILDLRKNISTYLYDAIKTYKDMGFNSYEPILNNIRRQICDSLSEIIDVESRYEFSELDQLINSDRFLFWEILSSCIALPDQVSEPLARDTEDSIKLFISNAVMAGSITNQRPQCDYVIDHIWLKSGIKNDWRGNKNKILNGLILQVIEYVPSRAQMLSHNGLYLGYMDKKTIEEIQAGKYDGIKETSVHRLFQEFIGSSLILEISMDLFIKNGYYIIRNSILSNKLICDLETLFKLRPIESEKIIDKKIIVESGYSYIEKAKMFDQYVKEHPGEPISSIIIDAIVTPAEARIAAAETWSKAPASVTAETPSSPLPEVAPLKWKDREQGETAPDFARRVYGAWLKDGMSKRVLRKLDAALLNELNNWVRNGNEMPDDIKLLTVGEENRRLLDAGPESIREHLGKFTGMEALREAARLRGATRKE